MHRASPRVTTLASVTLADADIALLEGVLQKIDTGPLAPFVALGELDEIELAIVLELAAAGARALLSRPYHPAQSEVPEEV